MVPELKQLIQEYPVVTIIGPRQAGKTTLAKENFKNFYYSNLEDPETRELAETDPKAFLRELSFPVIIDEIQRVPKLLSYIQTIVDEENKVGQYVLTGSHQLQLREAVTQSLAGRTAILNLLPLSIVEMTKNNISFDYYQEYVFKGFLPRIYDQKQRPRIAYANYFQTYVERDVRQLINLKDVSLFEKFLKLLAGRVGQVMDLTSLGNDVGVDKKTIHSWLSILEASFIIFKLPPYFSNFGKRMIKSPKYYFVETGLLSFLLGIKTSEQVTRDPIVGQIFENLIIAECLKARYNMGELPDLYFYRDNNGNEVDLIFQKGREVVAIEIKSASTYSSSQLKGIKRFRKICQDNHKSFLIYNGGQHTLGDNVYALPFKMINRIFEE